MRPGIGTINSTLSRGYGTLAGLGFIGAAVVAVPSTLLLDPVPPSESYLVTVAGIATGLACMALPWERMDPRWLHVVGALATVQAAAAVAVFGQAYIAFFFLIAMAVAYMVPDAKGFFAQVLLIGVALFGPVAYGPASAESTIQMGFVTYPLLILTGGVFSSLRWRMVADHRSHRLFAEETLALANRIAGSPIPGVKHPQEPPEQIDLPQWSRLRVSTRLSGFAACVLALPLLTSGLAAAGVKLPEFATDTLGSVGIDLPNQDSEEDMAAGGGSRATRSAGDGPAGAAPTDPAKGAGASAGKNEASGGHSASSNGGAQAQGESDSLTGAPTPTDVPPVVEPPNIPGDGAENGGGGSSHGGENKDPLGQTLDDTLNRVRALLGNRRDEPDEDEADVPRERSAEGSGDGLAGPGDEVDEGGGDDAEEDGSESCEKGEPQDDAAVDTGCPVELP